MKVKKIIWKDKPGHYYGPYIYIGYVGKLAVFHTRWSIVSGQEEKDFTYVLHCNFINLKQTKFKTYEEAKEYAQKAIDWIVKELTEA